MLMAMTKYLLRVAVTKDKALFGGRTGPSNRLSFETLTEKNASG